MIKLSCIFYIYLLLVWKINHYSLYIIYQIHWPYHRAFIYLVQLDRYLFFSQNLENCNFGRSFHGNEKQYEKNPKNSKIQMHFQYTVFGPLDEFLGFNQICYYECPHISGIYLESLLISILCNHKIGVVHAPTRILFKLADSVRCVTKTNK